ncbi:hypothetical protein BKA83DRAFT_4130602 [Pisolithus microcarpus]|nr:hypothetical protein BKA83DRAFT_4130602 [Pisolithus microcarpus]
MLPDEEQFRTPHLFAFFMDFCNGLHSIQMIDTGIQTDPIHDYYPSSLSLLIQLSHYWGYIASCHNMHFPFDRGFYERGMRLAHQVLLSKEMAAALGRPSASAVALLSIGHAEGISIILHMVSPRPVTLANHSAHVGCPMLMGETTILACFISIGGSAGIGGSGIIVMRVHLIYVAKHIFNTVMF